MHINIFMISETLCPMVWNHQFIDGTGRVKPCCRYQGTLGYIETDINDTFNSDHMAKLRKKMSAGEKPDGCRRCWQEEDSGKKSLRQRYIGNKKLGTIDVKNPRIEWLELAISNDCNLMCRMCDSKYSHKLFDEELKYYGKTQAKTKRTSMPIESVFPYVSTLKHLKITGGEPLITPDHWRLLDYIIDKGHAHHIYLNYSTNNTVYPKQHIIDRWKKFEHIELAISLDSIIAKENEYLRHGTKQDQALVNIERFVELQNEMNLAVIARPTITMLNILHLPETLEWLDERSIKHNATHLTHPMHMSVTVLSQEAKQLIVNKFNNYKFKNSKTQKSCEYIKNYMMSKDDTYLLDEFKKHTAFLDSTRNQNFKNIYPYYNQCL